MILTSNVLSTCITAPSTESPRTLLVCGQWTMGGGADVMLMYVSSTDSVRGVGGGKSSARNVKTNSDIYIIVSEYKEIYVLEM